MTDKKEEMRYKKYKRGELLEITLGFKNGETQRVAGYYWMNDQKNKRIVLVETFKPLLFNGKIWSKSFCPYDMIESIRNIESELVRLKKEKGEFYERLDKAMSLLDEFQDKVKYLEEQVEQLKKEKVQAFQDGRLEGHKETLDSEKEKAQKLITMVETWDMSAMRHNDSIKREFIRYIKEKFGVGKE